MTLLTDTPAAGEQSPATPASAAAPSSGEATPKPGEQTAAGKDPAPVAKPTAPETAKDNGDTAGAKPSGAPETYTLKAPEGYAVGEQATKALSDVARELGLTNEAAQKVVDKMAPALHAQSKANIAAMIEGWTTETQNHPQIGGEKLNEHLALAQKALVHVPPELRKLLGPVSEGGTGLGNHWAVIAGFAAIGRKLSPDAKVVAGSPPAPPPKSAMERLADGYGTKS